VGWDIATRTGKMIVAPRASWTSRLVENCEALDQSLSQLDPSGYPANACTDDCYRRPSSDGSMRSAHNIVTEQWTQYLLKSACACRPVSTAIARCLEAMQHRAARQEGNVGRPLSVMDFEKYRSNR
jgi:hypothetical protein